MFDVITNKEIQNFPENSVTGIAGRLYMDTGEEWNCAETQLKKLIEMAVEGKVTIIFGAFQFVCLEEQQGKASEYAGWMKSLIKCRTNLPDDKIKVSIHVVDYAGQAC